MGDGDVDDAGLWLALFWLLGYALNRLPVTVAFQKARWFHLGFILVTCWLFIHRFRYP